MEILWTEAHVEIGSLDPSDHWAVRDARGNGSADNFAQVAVERHPQPSAELSAAVRRDVDDVAAVVKFAAKVLGMWPSSDRDELAAAARVDIEEA